MTGRDPPQEFYAGTLRAGLILSGDLQMEFYR